jgi:hypothetical protein
MILLLWCERSGSMSLGLLLLLRPGHLDESHGSAVVELDDEVVGELLSGSVHELDRVGGTCFGRRLY